MKKIIVSFFIVVATFLYSTAVAHEGKTTEQVSYGSSNYISSKHRSTAEKSIDIKRESVDVGNDEVPKSGADGAINEVINKNMIDILSFNHMQNIFNAERLINFGAVIARLAILAIIFILLWKAVNRITSKVVRSMVYHPKDNYPLNYSAIAMTAEPIIKSVLHWFLSIIFFLITLSQLGVDISPIIYSFGVFSLAISIGAQTLVKDFICGILTLCEGIVTVGETVELNGNVGLIESMSLRAIEFRHNSGHIQIISFSDIKTLINLSRDYSVCNISIPVDHEAKLEDLKRIFFKVYQEMKADSFWGGKIAGELKFDGVEMITENAVYVAGSMRTLPDPSKKIDIEFKSRFHQYMQDLKIPYPKITNPFINVYE